MITSTNRTTVIAVLLPFLLSLSACSGLRDVDFPGVYKMDIQQGNVITQEKVDLLQIGLTREQVRYVMGTPLMIDLFNEDHWDYVYSLVQGDDTVTEERVRVVFKDGLVVAIETSDSLVLNDRKQT